MITAITIINHHIVRIMGTWSSSPNGGHNVVSLHDPCPSSELGSSIISYTRKPSLRRINPLYSQFCPLLFLLTSICSNLNMHCRYPKDTDKALLAKLTGLTRNQVPAYHPTLHYITFTPHIKFIHLLSKYV
mgnify:CR=1 FL=1